MKSDGKNQINTNKKIVETKYPDNVGWQKRGVLHFEVIKIR